MLRSGANDLGGTLMEETISRMAGSSYGSYESIRGLEAIAAAAGRPAANATPPTARSLPNASPSAANSTATSPNYSRTRGVNIRHRPSAADYCR